MTKLKVLVVSDYAYASGGVEFFVKELLAGLGDDFDCTLLTWRSDALVPEAFEKIVLLEYGDLRDAWPLMENADAIIVQASFNTRLLAALAGEFLATIAKPSITVMHTTAHSRPGVWSSAVQAQWLARLLEHSTRIVAVSANVEAALRDFSGWAFSLGEKTSVIQNASRLGARSVRAVRGRRRVSFVGRATPQTGWGLFAQLSTDLADSGIAFAANTCHEHLPQAAYPNITLSALLDDDGLTAFFYATDLLVVPYVGCDGLPMAVLEALACGVPVLGFDSPGVGDLLREHGQEVIAAEYGSLRQAVTDWHAGRLMIQAPDVTSVRTWGQSIDEYAELLRQVAGMANTEETRRLPAIRSLVTIRDSGEKGLVTAYYPTVGNPKQGVWFRPERGGPERRVPFEDIV